jgi:hypothetical protein
MSYGYLRSILLGMFYTCDGSRIDTKSYRSSGHGVLVRTRGHNQGCRNKNMFYRRCKNARRTSVFCSLSRSIWIIGLGFRFY